MNEAKWLWTLDPSTRSKMNRKATRKMNKYKKQQEKMEQKLQEKMEKKQQQQMELEEIENVTETETNNSQEEIVMAGATAARGMIDRIYKDIEEVVPHYIENDDIYQFFTDGYLTSRKITELKKVNINTISQLQTMKTTMTEDMVLSKIAKADTVGPEIAKAIFDLIDLYEFKTSNIASDVIIIDEKKKDSKEVVINPTKAPVNAPKKEDSNMSKQNKPQMTTQSAIPKAQDDKTVDASKLADVLLASVFNMCSIEKNVGVIKMNLEKGETERIGGSNIIFNSKVLLIENVYLKNQFDAKIKNMGLKLEGQENNPKVYFLEALKSLGKEYIKVSYKDNQPFYYTQKKYACNRLNYVQFDIEKIENRMSRKLSFDASHKTMKYINTDSNICDAIVDSTVREDGTAVYVVGKKVVNAEVEKTKVPKNIPHDSFKGTAVKVSLNNHQIKSMTKSMADAGTIKATATEKKEDIKMAVSVRVNPIKSHEFVGGSNEYVSCFEVIEVTTTKQEPKNKFDFDFTKPTPKAIETEKSRGYVYYIFNANSPKKGRYSFAAELQPLYEQIKFQIQEYFS